MAIAQTVDDAGNPINFDDPTMYDPYPLNLNDSGGLFSTPDVTDPTQQTSDEPAPEQSGAPAPAPAPASGAPQQQAPSLPSFGMGEMNMPAAPNFNQPDDSLTQSVADRNGLTNSDKSIRSQSESIFGSDPGTPGDRYSGGSGRKANSLRDTDIGKRFSGASRAGTAYGNTFDREGLTGGGKNARLVGGDNADLGSQQSDLLLQLLQLLGQQ